jgi:hypothetical protein
MIAILEGGPFNGEMLNTDGAPELRLWVDPRVTAIYLRSGLSERPGVFTEIGVYRFDRNYTPPEEVPYDST